MAVNSMVFILLGIWLEFSTSTDAAVDLETAPVKNVANMEWYSSTVSYWPFESFSDRVIRDWTGNNNGKINGTVHSVNGIVGSAIELTGKYSWIDFGLLPETCLNEPEACSEGFTIAFWLKLPTFVGNKIIVQLGQNRHSRGFTVWTRRKKEKKINFSVNGNRRSFHSMLTWPTVHWTHVSLVWRKNEQNLGIYFNCSLFKHVNNSVKLKRSAKMEKVTLMVGASHGHNKNAHMLMDEFAIWNRTLSEDELCRVVGIKTVHGGYSNWSSFSKCNKTCGNETQIRYRQCNNPAPQHRGQNCSELGPSYEERPCNNTPCPIHGAYGQWSSFTQCTRSCGSGQKYRGRQCNNPVPMYGGLNCSGLGVSFESASCNEHPCPVDGGYTQWSSFSECSKSCENGTQFRYRNCTNPAPAHGGKNCSHLGIDYIIIPCNTHKCPIDGGYTEWTNFTACTKTCGNGTKFRTRNCSNPFPQFGGKNCLVIGPENETIFCNTDPCPVDGGYTEWTEFSNCSKPCGNGTRFRFRNCTNPRPQHGGRNCSRFGDDMEVLFCNVHHCPIHGGYTLWSNFTECSVSCGGGVRTRNRTCTNPVPVYGGRNCSLIGADYQSLDCNTHPCPIHGGFTSWSNFTACSKTCGNGTRFRFRNCTNPRPQHGGRNCSRFGDDMEVLFCNVHHCPIHGGYTLWSNFTECSVSCGGGVRTRNRTCTNPVPVYGGRNCSLIGTDYQSRDCNTHPCPIHGSFTSWSNFTACSKTCGNGTRTRNRTCTNPAPKHGGRNCAGKFEEIEDCNTFPCPIDGGYTNWSNYSECTKSCGIGEQARSRNCTNPIPRYGGATCDVLGPPMQKRVCNIHPCPIDGGYTEWTNFTECSKSCGNGTSNRTRTCTNPPPQHGGRNCTRYGSSFDIRYCNVHPCPIHGGYTPWSNFSDCTKSCGNGTKRRFRNCTNPTPMYGGTNCSHLGPEFEIFPCNTHYCPIDGGYSPWTNYSVCSKSCGNGTRYRTRACNRPKPKHKGLNCSRLGPAKHVIPCNAFPCPIHGNYSAWSEFTSCDKTCNNGTKFRTRKCNQPAPQFGGRSCSLIGPDIEVVGCFLRHCPIDGGYSDWSEFGPCSKSCNTGIKNRTRICNKPEPKYGGKTCEVLGEAKEAVVCNAHPCPIHGGYTQWTKFSACSKTCEGGIRVRTRNCSNPTPMYGGRNCSKIGPSMERITCNKERCPDIVFNITMNLTNKEWTPELADSDSQEFYNLRRDLKSSIYRIYYKNGGGGEISGFNVRFRKGSVVAYVVIKYSNYLYQGITVLYDAIYVNGVLGTFKVSPINLATIDVPVRGPTNVTGFNTSSTTVLLSWDAVDSKYANGNITSYRITYKRLGKQYRKRRQIQTLVRITVPNQLSFEIPGLDKFTKYEFRVAGVNKRGVGLDSEPITVNTDQDRPLQPPPSISASNKSSTSVKVSWSGIPKEHIPGFLKGYRVYYRPLNQKARYIMSVTVGRDTRHFLLTKLDKYTKYQVDVCGYTIQGEGPTATTYVKTDEDVPTKPPQKVQGHNTSSTSIYVQWEPIPKGYIHGILRGYVVNYLDESSGLDNWLNVTLNGDVRSCLLQDLRKFTKYVIQVQGFTSKGDGKISKAVVLRTDQDVPDEFPVNLTGFNKSSTELYIKWEPLEKKYWNGIELGYKIFYVPLKATSEPEKIETVDEDSDSITLDQLGKFTWYRIKVAAFTSKGLGPISPEITLQTSEDVPSKAAIDLKARHTSHKSLLVEWKSIPKGYVHGILRGFRIHFWEVNRIPKKIQTKGVPPDSGSTELKDLLIYTEYAMEIIGFTSAGNGAVSRTVYARTDQYTPGAPPVNLRAPNRTSPTMIEVSWDPIPDPYDVHGILLGYRVFYTAVALSQKPLDKPMPQLSVTLENPPRTSVVLRNLSAFTRYHIYVLAFTIKGNGVKCPIIVAETCNCHRTLHTNWWESSPYVETPGSVNNSGIIPTILEDAVRTCCETCAEFNTTVVDFTWSITKKRARKQGLQEFRESIEDAEFSFPVYGFMDQKVYSGSFGFAPLVRSPGVALIIIGDEEGAAARMLIKSIMLCWPIVFLDIMLLWVLSIVIWFAETFNNSRHFPHNMLQGTWEGMWWAFASMTTLGYGDRIPRTPLGRVICIVWILIGVILIACFNSTMTSILTARILDKDIMLYGTKIAAIQNSSEYRLGVRKNARVNPNGRKYSNLEEIYNAMVNRDVKGILVDSYTVGSKKELFERKDLRVSKIYDFSSAYGVVLGGESKKLQTCFNSYLSEQRSYISQIIERNTRTIKVQPKAVSVQRSQGLFDASFPTYTKTVIICSTVLALILVLGAKFECAKKIGWITFKTRDKSKKYKPPTVEELRNRNKEMRREMSIVVQTFVINCKRRVAILKMKHMKELQQFAKLKKEYDSGPLQKGSFTKHNLWNIACNKKGNGFTSTLIKKAEQSNGHSNGFPFPKRFKKSKEVETIV